MYLTDLADDTAARDRSAATPRGHECPRHTSLYKSYGYIDFASGLLKN